jgi:hypothetical protein
VKTARCADAHCITINDVSMIDTAAGTGTYTTIVLGGRGFPVIAYWDTTNADLNVAHRANANCRWVRQELCGSVSR